MTEQLSHTHTMLNLLHAHYFMQSSQQPRAVMGPDSLIFMMQLRHHKVK